MEAQLVSFGNYLLSTYNVQVHSSDGKNTPLYVRQVSDADLRNWESLSPVSRPVDKIMECLHIIEGIFHAYCKQERMVESLIMANTGAEIYFELYEGESKVSSEHMRRDWLEALPVLDLTTVIIENLNTITGKGGGGVPFKDHTNYPSRYQIGEKVKLFLMPEGEETFPGINARIIAVHFTASKVKYDVEIKFYGDHATRLYNIDSILVQDLDYAGQASLFPDSSGTAKVIPINTLTNEEKEK